MIKNINVKSQEYTYTQENNNQFQQVCPILQLKDTKIQDVWQSNFLEELEKIMDLTQTFNVIAMDTEFPGVNFPTLSNLDQQKVQGQEQEYMLIQENVKKSKIIQIGITIADEQGRVPQPVSTWQFNFKFDQQLILQFKIIIIKDLITSDSLNLLKTAGIDFNKFLKEGLDVQYFSEYLNQSDIVMNDEIKWVVFHGGYDFGYFLQMLYGAELPDQSENFYNLLKIFFPTVYDLKYIIKDTELKDYGLSKLSIEYQIGRIGPQHQAGSDSLMTLALFFKLRESQLKEASQLEKIQNIVYGIGKGYSQFHQNRYNPQNIDQIQENFYYNQMQHNYNYGQEYNIYNPQQFSFNQEFMLQQYQYNQHVPKRKQ